MKDAIKGWGIIFSGVLGISLSVLLLAALWAPPAHAYETWDGGCIDCHGDFNGGNYTSLTEDDPAPWGVNLISGHVSKFGLGCSDCHSPGGFSPVTLNASSGITCSSCHGRTQDGPPTGGLGVSKSGAGLRKHHELKVGTNTCNGCHSTDPATPVAENIAPPTFITKSIDPCNDVFYGTAGLDNDGNDLRDGADPACAAPPPTAPADFNGDGMSDIGVFRDGGWYLDLNANYQWDGCGVDGCFVFGAAGQQPVVGDWTGTGQIRIGVFANGGWYLDTNGNGVWDGCGTDTCYTFGAAGHQAVVGDWNGTGQIMIGVFDGNGSWYLDTNGNGVWEGCGTDSCLVFGSAGDNAVVGDWNKSGKTNIGVHRPSEVKWYLDLNDNGQWDGSAVDGVSDLFGTDQDLPAN